MKVVAFFHLKEVRWSLHESTLARWRERFPQLEVVSVEDAEHLPAALADAEIFVGWRVPPEHFAAARRLRWIHSASAGIEDCLFPELVASDVDPDQLDRPARGLHPRARARPDARPGAQLPRGAAPAAARRVESLRGDRLRAAACASCTAANLAILGAGPIGANLARMAAALGMHVRVHAPRPAAAGAGCRGGVRAGAAARAARLGRLRRPVRCRSPPRRAA